MRSLLHKIHALLVAIRHLPRHAQSILALQTAQSQILSLQSALQAAQSLSDSYALSARNASDRAAQILFANEQLQAQLSVLQRDLADRLERAYGAAANWIALDGAASRRPLYSWVPIADSTLPAPTADSTLAPLGRTSARSAAAVISHAVEQAQSDLMAQTKSRSQEEFDRYMMDITQGLQSGEYTQDALGRIFNKSGELITT